MEWRQLVAEKIRDTIRDLMSVYTTQYGHSDKVAQSLGMLENEMYVNIVANYEKGNGFVGRTITELLKVVYKADELKLKLRTEEDKRYTRSCISAVAREIGMAYRSQQKEEKRKVRVNLDSEAEKAKVKIEGKEYGSGKTIYQSEEEEVMTYKVSAIVKEGMYPAQLIDVREGLGGLKLVFVVIGYGVKAVGLVTPETYEEVAKRMGVNPELMLSGEKESFCTVDGRKFDVQIGITTLESGLMFNKVVKVQGPVIEVTA